MQFPLVQFIVSTEETHSECLTAPLKLVEPKLTASRAPIEPRTHSGRGRGSALRPRNTEVAGRNQNAVVEHESTESTQSAETIDSQASFEHPDDSAENKENVPKRRIGYGRGIINLKTNEQKVGHTDNTRHLDPDQSFEDCEPEKTNDADDDSKFTIHHRLLC